MNVEDIVRSGLHDVADQAAPIADLQVTAVQRGRRRRTVRRLATTGGVALSVAAIAGIGVLVANNTGGNTATVIPPAASPSTVTPWWQTWSTGRHNGPIDQTFLNAAQASYDANDPTGTISVYAAGTAPDGTDWAMFTDPTQNHVVQWLQGWDGAPDYGTSLQNVVPGMTWSSFATPTRAGHEMVGGNVPHWLVVVGRPGTTEIDYTPDGSTWTPLDVQDGIAVVKVPDGYPPATARVRLSDATGVYATGAPDGSGAAEPDPGAGTAAPDGAAGTASPTPTPTQSE